MVGKHRPNSGERRGNLLSLGAGWTRKELCELCSRLCGDLDGCSVYTVPFDIEARNFKEGTNAKSPGQQSRWTTMKAEAGAIDVILTQESWTRRARRAKHAQATAVEPSSAANTPTETTSTDPILMARIHVSESSTSSTRSPERKETGLTVEVRWTYGRDGVKFESFAMYLLSAIERSVAISTGQTQER